MARAFSATSEVYIADKLMAAQFSTSALMLSTFTAFYRAHAAFIQLAFSHHESGFRSTVSKHSSLDVIFI